MAQLPPKIPPTLTSNWPDYHNKFFLHNNPPPPAAATTTNLSWVDEFLDFSSSRRASHRRSISDSDIAFSETHEFDKIDDEQFLSMFGDDKPSRQCSSFTAEQRPPELKAEPEEVQSPSDDSGTEASQREGSAGKSTEIGTDSGERITDPKRVKRILANRQSAQRSRVRKMQYVSDLERSVNSLQAEVSVLSPRVAFLDHQRLLLNVDNGAIKQRIAALAQDRIFKDAHQEALKKEIERLNKVYEQQQQIRSKDVENNNAAVATSPTNPSSEPEPTD